jgi:hypothetical protein
LCRQDWIHRWISDSDLQNNSLTARKLTGLLLIHLSPPHWNAMPRALFQLTCINLLLLQLHNVPALHPLDSKPAASNDKKRKRSGVRLYKDTILNNDLRDELHIQMYK